MRDHARTEPVKVTLANGAVAYVEATPIGDQRDRVSASNAILNFTTVTDAIEGVAQGLTEVFDRVKPSEATVEFGLEVGVEAGQLTALFVKGTGTASLKVTLTWGK